MQLEYAEHALKSQISAYDHFPYLFDSLKFKRFHINPQFQTFTFTNFISTIISHSTPILIWHFTFLSYIFQITLTTLHYTHSSKQSSHSVLKFAFKLAQPTNGRAALLCWFLCWFIFLLVCALAYITTGTKEEKKERQSEKCLTFLNYNQ